MKNQITINRNYTSLTEEMIDNALTIEGAEVYVYHVGHRKTGYGHWFVELKIKLNDEYVKFGMTTTDSVSIDNWNNDDENDGDLGEDIQANFIVRILEENDYRIEELVSAE